jgi:hypothetical protein
MRDKEASWEFRLARMGLSGVLLEGVDFFFFFLFPMAIDGHGALS